MEIAVIAHDRMKTKMVDFLTRYKEQSIADRFQFIATASTGSKVEEQGFRIKKMLSGPLGGDAQIAARVAEVKTKPVLFFKDPLSSHIHEPDITIFIRVCDVHNVPLATNPASAELILKAILQQS